MPISEKQLAANKANCLKSTGPRTPEGKAAASMNAVRHGLFARTLLLPSEDPAEFEAFAADLLDDLRPEGGLETSIATRLVATAWRLRRVPVAEAAIFSPDLSAIGLPTADPSDVSSAENGFVSADPATSSTPSTQSTPPNPAATSHGSHSSYSPDPSDLTAPGTFLKNGFVSADPAHASHNPSASNLPAGSSDVVSTKAEALATAGPGTHYLRRIRPGADPLGGISRHEARLHRQFERDLQPFDAARERRLKREREDHELALRRAQDPNDPLYDPAMDPFFESRQRRLQRWHGLPDFPPELQQRRARDSVAAAAPNAVAPELTPENGFVSADPAHGVRSSNSKAPDPLVHVAPHQSAVSLPKEEPSPANGFVSADTPDVDPSRSGTSLENDSSRVRAKSSWARQQVNIARRRSGATSSTVLTDNEAQGLCSRPQQNSVFESGSKKNGFVSRKSHHTPHDIEALYQEQLRIERLLGLPETDEVVEALF